MTTLPEGISIVTPRVAAPRSRSTRELDTNDFLRLMTEQMKQQDPFEPTDNSQMVAQMAQMSSSSGIAEINATLKGIATTLADHTALLQSLESARTPAAAPAA